MGRIPITLKEFHKFLNFESKLKLSFSKPFLANLNYASTSNILEVTKFYRFGENSFWLSAIENVREANDNRSLFYCSFFCLCFENFRGQQYFRGKQKSFRGQPSSPLAKSQVLKQALISGKSYLFVLVYQCPSKMFHQVHGIDGYYHQHPKDDYWNTSLVDHNLYQDYI